MNSSVKIISLVMSLFFIDSLNSMDHLKHQPWMNMPVEDLQQEKLIVSVCDDINMVLEDVYDDIDMVLEDSITGLGLGKNYIKNRIDFLKSTKDLSLSNKRQLLLFNAVQWIIQQAKYYQVTLQRCIKSRERYCGYCSTSYNKLHIITNIKSELETLEWPLHLKQTIQKYMLTGPINPKEFNEKLNKQRKAQAEYLSSIHFKQD